MNLLDRLKAEFEIPFSGWDFSHLEGRMEESVLPWNYRMILEAAFASSASCLDMGTGGGEFLDSFAKLPGTTFATERYAPNLPLARTRLGRRGVEVREVGEDNKLPFEPGAFDLVVNKHEEFDGAEVFRTLKKGGTFVTQQVGGLNDINLNAMLGSGNLEYFDWCLAKAIAACADAGLSVVRCDEDYGYTRFYDIEDIVYYLKCIPWQIGDFSVDAYADRLVAMHDLIARKGYLDLVKHRFYLVAEKR